MHTESVGRIPSIYRVIKVKSIQGTRFSQQPLDPSIYSANGGVFAGNSRYGDNSNEACPKDEYAAFSLYINQSMKG